MMSGAGLGGRMVGMKGGGMPDMNAMMAAAMRSGGYPGMAPPPEEEGVTYVCIADIRITERNGPAGGPKVYEMRSVGHVLQKKLDIEEASPIVRDKLSRDRRSILASSLPYLRSLIISSGNKMDRACFYRREGLLTRRQPEFFHCRPGHGCHEREATIQRSLLAALPRVS